MFKQKYLETVLYLHLLEQEIDVLTHGFVVFIASLHRYLVWSLLICVAIQFIRFVVIQFFGVARLWEVWATELIQHYHTGNWSMCFLKISLHAKGQRYMNGKPILVRSEVRHCKNCSLRSGFNDVYLRLASRKKEFGIDARLNLG